MPANECIALYDDGEDITVHAGSAITGKRFVKVSAAKQSDALGGNIVAAPAGAGEHPIGVAGYDIASGSKGPVLRGHKIVPITCGAAVTAGAAVMSDANGKAVTWTSAASEANRRCGVAINTTTAADQELFVALDL